MVYKWSKTKKKELDADYKRLRYNKFDLKKISSNKFKMQETRNKIIKNIYNNVRLQKNPPYLPPRDIFDEIQFVIDCDQSLILYKDYESGKIYQQDKNGHLTPCMLPNIWHDPYKW